MKRNVPDRNKVIYTGSQDRETRRRLEQIEDDAQNAVLNIEPPDFSGIEKLIRELEERLLQRIEDIDDGGGGGDDGGLPNVGELVYWLSGGENYSFIEDFENRLIFWEEATIGEIGVYAAPYPDLLDRPTLPLLAEGANDIIVPHFSVLPTTGTGGLLDPVRTNGEWLTNYEEGLSVGNIFFSEFPSGYTVLIVCSHTTPTEPYSLEGLPDEQVIFSFENVFSAQVRRLDIVRTGAGKIGIRTRFNFYDTDVNFPTGTCVITLRVNFDAEQMLIRLNGETIGTFTADDPQWFGSDYSFNIALGRARPASLGATRYGYWSGTINELLMYDGVLSPSNVIEVESYLVQKYALEF
jgi:hypothetical protein